MTRRDLGTEPEETRAPPGHGSPCGPWPGQMGKARWWAPLGEAGAGAWTCICLASQLTWEFTELLWEFKLCPSCSHRPKRSKSRSDIQADDKSAPSLGFWFCKWMHSCRLLLWEAPSPPTPNAAALRRAAGSRRAPDSLCNFLREKWVGVHSACLAKSASRQQASARLHVQPPPLPPSQATYVRQDSSKGSPRALMFF